MVSNLKGQKRCKLHSSKWRAPGPWVELWKLLPKESKKAVTRYSFARLFVQCRPCAFDVRVLSVYRPLHRTCTAARLRRRAPSSVSGVMCSVDCCLLLEQVQTYCSKRRFCRQRHRASQP